MKSLASIICILLLAGCTTNKQYDAQNTENVKAALTPVMASVVHRVIENSPEHSEQIAAYMRAVGKVCCEAQSTGQIGPYSLIYAVDAATAPLLAEGVSPDIIDAKNVLLALYRIQYADRYNAELSPEKWPYHVLALICDSVDQGLKDAGKAGCK